MVFESFLGSYKIVMVWKKIAAAHFLPETSSSIEMTPQIVVAKRWTVRRVPHRLRSQKQKDWARLQEK